MVNLTELLVVLILALVLLGKPDKIPEYAKAVSKAVKDLTTASNAIKNDVKETTDTITKSATYEETDNIVADVKVLKETEEQ